MIIAYRQLILQSIKEVDLENLRLARNSYRHFLIESEEIHAGGQKEWFTSFDRDKNSYYVIRSSEQTVGFIFVKNIARDKSSFETGVLAMPEFIGTSLLSLAALMLSHYMFYHQDFTQAIAWIHKDNQAAMAFSKSLGFRITKEYDNFNEFRSTKQDYTALMKQLKLFENMTAQLRVLQE